MNKHIVNIDELKFINDRRNIPTLLINIGAEIICEVGVREGIHLQGLLVPCVKQAVAVDIWKDTGIISQNDENLSQDVLDAQYKHVLNMAYKDLRINIVKDFSINAAKQFPDNYFDFVYLDADHTEESVYQDLCAWWPKVRSGGILSGHDYSVATIHVKFGVIEAISRFMKQNTVSLYTDNDSDWFIPKP